MLSFSPGRETFLYRGRGAAIMYVLGCIMKVLVHSWRERHCGELWTAEGSCVEATCRRSVLLASRGPEGGPWGARDRQDRRTGDSG